MDKDKLLRVGIAGYGVVGKRRRMHIDQHQSLQTVAVCDRKFRESGVMADGVKSFTNYKELLDESLDILFVCLPNYLAAEATIAGLEKGLHIFCEKPPGRDVADIRRVIDVEKRHPGQLLKYGFNHRYHDSVRDALKIVKSGELGEIVNLRGIYGKSKIITFSGDGAWRAERKYAGGGILLDQGIHMVDLMRLFCGDFRKVKSFISNEHWNHDVEDNAYAIMQDDKGRIAMLHSSATQWQHRFSLHIALTKGYLELRGILSGSKSYGVERLAIGRRSHESDTGSQHEEVISYLEDNSWRDEIYEFADNIINRNGVQYGGSKDGLETMKLVYRIYYADPQWRDAYGINNPDEEELIKQEDKI
ncbi:MAG: Gfo/Idh/MocA family oxidoreductase [Candidatus Omnitrophica bacterium]|nr:Gfo/Idh/MocA family oxidoreductase [Candidatus Omnitrophota bacterium]